MNPRCPRHRKDAMTLIEVIVAMAILGIGIIVLSEAASRCLAVVRIARNYHAARTVFDQGELMFPLLTNDQGMVNLDVSHAFPNGFTFTRSAEPTEDKELLVVKTTVSWAERGRNSKEETLTYLFYTNGLAAP